MYRTNTKKIFGWGSGSTYLVICLFAVVIFLFFSFFAAMVNVDVDFLYMCIIFSFVFGVSS